MNKLYATILEIQNKKWKLVYHIEKVSVSENGQFLRKLEFLEKTPLIFVTKEGAKQEAKKQADILGLELIIQ